MTEVTARRAGRHDQRTPREGPIWSPVHTWIGEQLCDLLELAQARKYARQAHQ